MYEVVNARIHSTFLGFEDHGIFTCLVRLDYGDSAQSFGGYFLEAHPNMIQSILKVVGVDSWEGLVGKHIRVRKETSISGKILGIGHIVLDQWYFPEG